MNILRNIRHIFGKPAGTGRAKPYGKGIPDFSDPNSMLTSSQAAEFLNVHIQTLRRWCKEGVLEAYHLGPRGDRRFRVRDLNDFLAKCKGNGANQYS